MVAQSVPSAPPAPDKAGPAHPGRLLWQAPVFVLGVTALVAVLLTRPTANDDPTRAIDRDLAVARANLGRSDGDLETTLTQLRRALDRIDRCPDRAGEAWYLLGTAQMRLGDRDALTAVEFYPSAAHSLREAERLTVPDADQPKLQYRLARVGFLTREDPARVIERLKPIVERADDRAEAYDLLCKAYLALREPDLEGALWANEQYRNVPEVGDRDRAPAQLTGGELLLRLGRTDEARRTLEKISPKAPPAIVAKARMLQARSLQDENRWSEAVAQWQKVMVDAREGVEDPAAVLYQLGLCYRQMAQPGDATRVWEDCLARSRGAEGPAAALHLADLRLQDASPEAALRAYEAAVRGVSDADNWNNPLYELKRARELFERGVQVYRAAGRFDAALNVAGLYAGIAEPGKALVLKAEISGQWAGARQARANGPDAEAEQQEAARLFRQAGEAYASAARGTTDPVKKADLLWLAASRLLDGQDTPQAAARLAELRKLCADPATSPLPPARVGEACYLHGEALRRQQDLKGAETAYVDCVAYASPFAYRARYQLAVLLMERGELDQAAEILEKNLGYLRFDPDPEAQEKSLFALGELFHQRRDYRMAARRLEEGLEKFKDNPGGPRAKYLLAESYRQQANQENQNYLLGEKLTAEAKEHFQAEHRRWMQKAADAYLELSHLLDKTPESLPAESRVQVPFQAADCRFNLGQYEEALQIYAYLAEKYPKQPAGLNALGGMVRCHSALGEAEQVRERLTEIRGSLASLNEADRQKWEEWLTIASKPFQMP